MSVVSHTLYRSYGNTSSSSIWYEMDFIRKHSSLRRGQRVLQVAFGSGFKCNSAVWLCLNNPPVPQVDEELIQTMSAVKGPQGGACFPAAGKESGVSKENSAAKAAEPKKVK